MSTARSPRRAVLIFAENAGLDLNHRKFPRALHSLLKLPALANVGAVDAHLFTSSLLDGSAAGRVHRQKGSSFRERFENAIETLSAMGYDEIVAIGRDCPALCAADIAQAFAQLDGRRLVLGPDHRGGCYLIAFRTADRDLLRGIQWKRNTDCAQLQARAGADAISLLPVKHDLDSIQDLRLAARADIRVARALALLFQELLVPIEPLSSFVHAAMRFIRLHAQIPPPLGAA